VRTALVFACDEQLLRFCDEHDIPAFGAWPLLAPYAMCERVDRGSGVKMRAIIEVLKRGVDVVYSDADVVWRRPFVAPRKASGAPAYDVAFQSYSPLPDNDTEALVQYGTNFGLVHARASRRAVAWLQALLPRVASHFEFVTARHWRTRQGLDQFRVYGCNDQNALHEFLAEPRTVCQYVYDRGVLPANGAADSKQCAVVGMLAPSRYPTAMPFIYARRDALADSTLVALHMTTYPGANKRHGARELRLWAADDAAVRPDERFVVLDPAQLKKHGSGESRDSAVLLPLARLVAFALAADRIAILPELPCAWHPLYDTVDGARAKPTRDKPYVLGRTWCTADLYFELDALANSSVAFRPASFLARLEAGGEPPLRKTIDLASGELNRETVQRATEAANEPAIVAWHDFGSPTLRVAEDLAARAQNALQWNTFFDWSR